MNLSAVEFETFLYCVVGIKWKNECMNPIEHLFQCHILHVLSSPLKMSDWHDPYTGVAWPWAIPIIHFILYLLTYGLLEAFLTKIKTCHKCIIYIL